MAVLIGLSWARPVVASGEVVSAPAALPEAGSSVDTNCLQQAAGGSCRREVNSDPTQPYLLLVPRNVSELTAVVAGGSGAGGADGVAGGNGGLVVAEIPVVPGSTLSVYVATGAQGTEHGSGWLPGGDGVSDSDPLKSNSGGGGGASAVIGPDGALVVAGGGGGAGGSATSSLPGGIGGSAGLPALAGFSGRDSDGAGGFSAGGSPTTPYKAPATVPIKALGGNGGCSNDYRCQGSGSPDGGGWGGNGTFPDKSQEPGGGGGAGWPNGGWGGGGATTDGLYPIPASGGGGGGGQNYVTAAGQDLSSGSIAQTNGYVEFRPAGLAQRVDCAAGNGGQTVSLPTGTASVLAIAAGASGGDTSDPSWTGVPGVGALAVATIAVGPADRELAVFPGCVGGGRKPQAVYGLGNGGGGGDAGTGADQGGGGGGGSAVLVGTGPHLGTRLLVAGGGGGSGGGAFDIQNPLNNQPGWPGGSAGQGFDETGNGSGAGAGGGGRGGAGGGSATQDGQPGTDGNDPVLGLAGGGGGGGGGGMLGGGQGHGGGDGSGGYGGGAGTSYYDANPTDGVTDPLIGFSSQSATGYVTLVPLTSPSTLSLALQLTGSAAGLPQSANFPYLVSVQCTLGGVVTFPPTEVQVTPGQTQQLSAAIPGDSTCTVDQGSGDMGRAWSGVVQPPAGGNVLVPGQNNLFTITDDVDFLQQFDVSYTPNPADPPGSADYSVSLNCYLNENPISLQGSSFQDQGDPAPADAVTFSPDGDTMTLHFTGASRYIFGQPRNGPGPLTGTQCALSSQNLNAFLQYSQGETVVATAYSGPQIGPEFALTGLNEPNSPIPASSLNIQFQCFDPANGGCAPAAAAPLASRPSVTSATTTSGSLTVRAARTGAAAARWPDPTTVTVTCTDPGQGGATHGRRFSRTLVFSTGIGTQTISGLVSGSGCTVRRGTGGGTSVHYATDPTPTGTPPSTPLGRAEGIETTVVGHRTVTVTADFPAAPWRVSVQRVGSAAKSAAASIRVSGRCTTPAGSTVPGSDVFTSVASAGATVLGAIPVGALCSVQPVSGRATGITSSAPITVSAQGSTSSVQLDYRKPAQVTIRVQTAGAPTPQLTGRIAVFGRCWSPEHPAQDLALTAAGTTVTNGGITPAVTVPVGYHCGGAAVSIQPDSAGTGAIQSSWTSTTLQTAEGASQQLLVTLTATTQAPPTHPTAPVPPVTPHPPSTPELASTGTPVISDLDIAALLILSGAAALLVGARRRRRVR